MWKEKLKITWNMEYMNKRMSTVQVQFLVAGGVKGDPCPVVTASRPNLISTAYGVFTADKRKNLRHIWLPVP